mmetsp:Transcript_31158/g.74065  ORF Transcript_31158/g.74065 Transcript_31158/m.74065 type:complete len:360 (+) Transcript_31158:422-1501(+)
MEIASSSLPKRNSGAIGPKVSCLKHSISVVAPARTVGWWKYPPEKAPCISAVLPPTRGVAPFCTASSTCATTLARPLELMSGPQVASGSKPLPSLRAATFSARRAANVSYTDSWTRIRLAHMHVCPAFRKAERAAPEAARSRSASSKTMSGALPPSSSETFLTVSAAPAISFFPTAVDPVKPIFLTASDARSVLPMAFASPVTTLMTPGGIPARWASSARASAVSGVASAGFRTTVQPAASAGATFLVIMDMGKLKGVMAAATPTGCRAVMKRLLPDTVGMTSPWTRPASAANHRTEPTPESNSAFDSGKIFPHSAVIMLATSSLARTSSSAHLFRKSPRCAPVRLDQALNASLAAETA